jgi:putative PIN family toxin of toxin-antitoxin system
MLAEHGLRVVIDTSILIRYLIRPSAAVKELIEQRWLSGEIQMVTAPELIAELEGVLQRERMQQFIRPEEGQALIAAIYGLAEILPSLGPLQAVTRDPKDDRFVACALAARAAYVISLDKDILVLGSLGGVRMVTPTQLIRTLNDPRRN